MATRTSLVTFEDAAARIGVLPSLEPRPNTKNLRALIKALTEAVQGIPSYQSEKYGYMGMVVTPEEYVLTGEQPWQDFPDPGYHRELGGTASKQKDRETEFQARKTVYVSQENVRNAINQALTKAVPATFRRAGGSVGPVVYTATDDQEQSYWIYNGDMERQHRPKKQRRKPPGGNHGIPRTQLKQCFSNWKSFLCRPLSSGLHIPIHN